MHSSTLVLSKQYREIQYLYCVPLDSCFFQVSIDANLNLIDTLLGLKRCAMPSIAAVDWVSISRSCLVLCLHPLLHHRTAFS
jgi:hypothetical protein